MRTKVVPAPGATVNCKSNVCGNIVRLVAQYAHNIFLSQFKLMTQIDQTGKFRVLTLRRNPPKLILARIRTDIIRGISVHEWYDGKCLIHFVIRQSKDPSYCAKAYILRLNAI